MKMLKSVLVLILTLALVVSFAGCHKQNEVAVEIDGVSFTSAMYSYAMLSADMEARNLVDKALGTSSNDTTTQTDYLTQTVEDTPFVTWVENRTMERLGQYAAYYNLCKENGVEIDEETKKQIDSNVDYYYKNYEQMYSANGIGKETYRTMMTYEYYYDLYFDFLYGKDGSKAVPAADIEKLFADSYRAVFVLEADLSNQDETGVASAKSKLEEYKTRVESGEELTTLYNEYHGYVAGSQYESYAVTDEMNCLSAVADPEVDSDRGATYWADIKDLPENSVVILTESDNSKARLVKVMSHDSDAKYIEAMDSTLRRTIKLDEFDTDMEAYVKTLEVKKHSYAMNQFKVEKISYGETASAAQ